MLPATLIALYLELPLSDLGSFLEGNIFEAGSTLRDALRFKEIGDYRKILIIDDSILTGETFRNIKSKIDCANLPLGRDRMLFAAVYAAPEVANLVRRLLRNMSISPCIRVEFDG